jgi:hypothetical protein
MSHNLGISLSLMRSPCLDVDHVDVPDDEAGETQASALSHNRPSLFLLPALVLLHAVRLIWCIIGCQEAANGREHRGI